MAAWARWHLLSYADVPIAVLQRRCAERRWFVHDRMTGHWTRGDDEPSRTDAGSTREGPLFLYFDTQHNEVLLRYPKRALRQFGTPLTSIANAFGVDLNEEGRIVTVTIAEMERFGDEVDAIWVEWVPGRVLEIPVAMLQWRSGPELFSLEEFDWSAVACGDEMDLRLVAGEALSPDRIEVVAWHRGARAACVPFEGRALLPNGGPVEDGGVVLGAGQFQFTMPLAPKAHQEPAYLLSTSNRPESAAGQRLNFSDTILIEVRSAAEAVLGVAGAPQLEARPDREKSDASWKKHPLTARLFEDNPNSFLLRRHFVDLIQAAGGALPVTLEAQDQEHGVVWFSLRRKSPQIPVGRFSQATVLGVAADSDWAALSFPGGLRMWPLREIVSCVPQFMWPTVCREMIAQRVPAWWRQTAADPERPTTGLTEGVDGDLWVRPVLAVGDNANCGLLVRACRSQRLYWIPRAYLAWTELEVEEIHRLFVKPSGNPTTALRANIKAGPDGVPFRVSLVHTAEALREERMLYPGYQLMVDVVKTCETPAIAGGRSWLIRSRETRLLMRCDVAKELTLKAAEPQLMEVESRRFDQVRRVRCAPYGQRIVPVDLPPAVLRQIENAAAPKRTFSRWREDLLHFEQSELERLRQGPPDPAPDVRLSWAWELCGRRNVFEPAAWEIATSWVGAVSKAEPCALPEALMAAGALSAALGGWTSNRNPGRVSADRGWTILTTFLGDLHRRLVRSRHIAILLLRLSRSQLRSDARFAAVHQRLVRLLSEPLDQAGRAEVRRLAEQLLIDPGMDRHQFAGALLCCLGLEPPPQAMPPLLNVDNPHDEIRLMDDITLLCAPFTGAPRQSDEKSQAIAAALAPIFNAALQRVRQFESDVILLGEVPVVLSVNSGARAE